MKTVKEMLVCVLLAACAWAAAMAGMARRAAARAADAVPGELAATRLMLAAEADLARVQAVVQVEAARKEALALVDRQSTAWRKELAGQVEAIRTTFDNRAGELAPIADRVAAVVEGIRGDWKPVLEHAGSVAGQVDAAAPLFLDCEYNPDCVFNRYVGAAQGIETAARNVGVASGTLNAALPGFVKSADALAADSAASAANIKRLTTPKWYDRLIGYALNGAILYRNLNPVTSLTVAGAEVMAGRP